MQFNPWVTGIEESPISATFALVSQRSGARPLLDLSQAAPNYATAPIIEERIAQVAAEPDGGRYSPSLGLPPLREEFAAELSRDYRGTVAAANVMLTAGCNQAFCVAASALAAPGDEIIVSIPYYFNHSMWCDAEGISIVPLIGPAEAGAASELVTERTRAILIVTPGNPTGITLSPQCIAEFAELARQRNIALIIDETYRNFRSTKEPAHTLFAEDGWGDVVVSLHSFSKDLAIPGYRVGALVAGTAMIDEAAKLLDCVAIAAPRIGQEAALAGLREAGEWRAEKAAMVEERHAAFRSAMASAPGGFELVSSGAYFGWVRHPFDDEPTEVVVRDLILDHDVLAIPGTAFGPGGERMIRFSFANLEPELFDDLAKRLSDFSIAKR